MKYGSLALAVIAVGCTGSVEPDPLPASSFFYTPTERTLAGSVGSFLDFRVGHDPESELNVVWQVNGRDAGIGPRFRFFPAATRLDTVVATASWQGQSDERRWLVTSRDDRPTQLEITPETPSLLVVVGRSYDFSVTSSRADQTRYDWTLDRLTVGDASTLRLTPTVVGAETLQVAVTTPDRTVRRSWALETFTESGLPPESPRALQVAAGPEVGSLLVSWLPAHPRGTAVANYQVAISYDGPIDEVNWSAASVLIETTVAEGQWSYLVEVPPDTELLSPGQQAWFAARSINVGGVPSVVSRNFATELAAIWWATGTVRDETGRLLPQVLVRDTGGDLATVTDDAGRYRIGPFSDAESVQLTTETPDLGGAGQDAWYDALSEPLHEGVDEDWDFLLIRQLGSVGRCGAYDGSFLTFLRNMTRTVQATDLRPNSRLYKWDTYPVTVWAPEFTSSLGLDFGALCRQSIRDWNQLLGQEFLTLVADSTAARITFRYGDDGPNFLGRASLTEPSEPKYVLGDTVPGHVDLYLLRRLNTEQLVREVALHELGHALGLSGHAVCSDQGYLMYTSPVGALDNGLQNAIHPDELRAVKLIRDLPQGLAMDRYRTGTP